MFMKNSILSIGTYILWIALMFLYISGCIHSEKKHSDPGIVRYSPFSIYRGLEKYWHNEKSEVDWGNRLKSDVYIIFQMMTTETSKLSVVQEETEKFNQKILSYPSEKISYLKNAAHSIYNYFVKTRSKLLSYIDSLQNGNYQFDSSSWMYDEQVLEDSLVINYDLKELKGSIDSLSKTLRTLKFSASFGEVEEVNIMEENIIKIGKSSIMWMERIYEMIFKEKLTP